MYNKKPLTLICVQPCLKYYAWQVEVMLTNFKSLNMSIYDIRCLFAFNKNESDWQEKLAVITKLEAKFSNFCRFFYYEDTREYPINYISSIRPNLLKQHFKDFPQLKDRAVFYHDCDIVFTKYPDFLQKLCDDDMNWYVSDTKSYIGHKYIISKGQDVLDKMCEIVGIHPEFVRLREEESGGAQYLMKGVDWQFFEKMEKDCEKLYKDITVLNNEKKKIDPKYHELQIWCADMWCLLWGAWMRGYKTNVIPEMDFCWATDAIERWDEKYIFHNAGVTSDRRHELFFKGDYTQKYPYEEDFSNFKTDRASYKYAQLVKSLKDKSFIYE